MNVNKNEMLSVEDVSNTLKISKSQVYKILKKNKNIERPILKINRKTFISKEGIEYIEKVFNKTISKIDSNYMGISLEEVAATSNTIESYKNKNLDDVDLNTVDNETKGTDLNQSNTENILIEHTINENINIQEKEQDSNDEQIYVAPINFQGNITFEENQNVNNEKLTDTLSEEERLKIEEEKLLEKHCKEVDTKLINLKEKLIEKQQLNKKGFFKKVISNIFRSN